MGETEGVSVSDAEGDADGGEDVERRRGERYTAWRRERTQTGRLADTETEAEIDIERDGDTQTGAETAIDTESARDRCWQSR